MDRQVRGQLDATPHRWCAADKKNYPLRDVLDDCSRVCAGAKLDYGEDLPAYFDFLPTAFREHGLSRNPSQVLL